MPLSRLELFRKLGAVKTGPDLEKATKLAYEQLEEEIWRSVPQKYATSFWASAFPIHEKSCGRQNLYNLLNIPPAEPFPARSRGITEIGKAVEYQIVYRWGKAGYTIGGSVPLEDGGPIAQLALEDPDTWLSGNLDAVLDLRPAFDAVLPVDIKSKDSEPINQMRVSALNYEAKHYAQVQAYIYLCNLYHDEMGWSDMGLERARGGCLFYVSRANPRNCFQFYFDANWHLINSALERLKQWKSDFLFDKLPAREKGWLWTEEPCKWCSFKKHACKPDHRAEIDSLSESNAIEWASTMTDYSLDYVKRKVENRWT